MFSSDLFRKLFNDAELTPCCVRISLNLEMFCTALTFNLCLHLLWSIGCQICWYHWFWCHVRARYVTLDIPLKRSHLALSLMNPDWKQINGMCRSCVFYAPADVASSAQTRLHLRSCPFMFHFCDHVLKRGRLTCVRWVCPFTLYQNKSPGAIYPQNASVMDII